MKTKERFFLVSDGEGIVQKILNVFGVEEDYPRLMGEIFENGYFESIDDGTEINEIQSFRVFFHAIDGKIEHTRRSPAGVSQCVIDHVGSLTLDGDVAEDGVIIWTGVEAKCRLGKREIPKSLFRGFK